MTWQPTIPIWLKLAFPAFLCVLVPIYWREYGPSNFLWFSDIALGFTAVAVVFDLPFLACMVAVGVLPLELAWCLDFATGSKLIGLAAYMFDDHYSLFLRALSLFHLAIPPTTIWMLYRFGYDRRAFSRQMLLLWLVLWFTFLFTDPALNINWVFGPGAEPQHWIDPRAYFAAVLAIWSLVVLVPMHLLLRWLFPAPVGI
jgi:hypothetical protein